ncbi:ABC transporter permease [Asticcacaulis sp. 201]|uniref:ABC transporter permease n=1 Tax=Asticcacaulis sp. 201 TaxID=3028787 RepID=UPI0029163D0C|nr:ABC transporter permease [Asticcacaulis sp. 201]MDV6332929.1 ABC transporter permease [Asticcacaulis sp. 201]
MIPGVADFTNAFRLLAMRWSVYLLMLGGLVLGFGTAILIGLYIHDELTYDQFIPNVETVHFVSADFGPRQHPLVASDRTPAGVARWLRADIPQTEAVARLSAAEWPMRTPRRWVKERFYWADPNIFDVLQLPFVSGHPRSALSRPGSIVLTERMARAYFGRTDVIGRTLISKDNFTFRVTGILKDFPANTHLDREIFARGAPETDLLSVYDTNPSFLWANTYTYVRFKSGASLPNLQAKLLESTKRRWQGDNNLPVGYHFLPLRSLHFQPHGDGEMKPRGHADSIAALSLVALATLILAAINFAGLVLAEKRERRSEMAVQTVLGARRIDLIVQILKEAILVYFVAVIAALALLERVLPTLNRSLDLNLELWHRPVSLLCIVTVGVIVSSLASAIVPALIISKPYGLSRSLTSNAHTEFDSPSKWTSWVTAQMALVIVLIIASQTMSRQWSFATEGALNFSGDNVIMVRLGELPVDDRKFRAALLQMPGVEAVAESFGTPTTDFVRPGWINRPGRPLVSLTRNSVHPDFFKVYGVNLVAGRNLSGTYLTPEEPREVLINLAAVRALGFANPQAALGHDIQYETDRTKMRSTIVGVVPDLRFSTLYEPIEPMLFDNFAKYFIQLNIRLRAFDSVRTEGLIDQAWLASDPSAGPIDRRRYTDYLLQQYHDLRQQMRVFYLVSAVAIVLSALGLTGVSIFLKRNQVREIAVYRALGANASDIFLSRLLPFWRPLVISNLIAWPVAWLVLRTWLGSFADHVPLTFTSFVVASAVATLSAVLTLAAHSFYSSRQRFGTTALRHK